MTYASLQDLIDRYGEAAVIELADRTDPPSGVIEARIVDGARARTGATIDSYIGRRHPLPLPAVPGSLVAAQCTLLWEDLHGDRPTEAVTAAADRARAWLKAIADGGAVLEGLPATAAATGRPVAISAPPRVFTDDSLGSF